MVEKPYITEIGGQFHRITRREWIPKLTQLLKANEDELLTAWFAERM